MPKAWTFFIKNINYIALAFIIVTEIYVYNIHNKWPTVIIHVILILFYFTLLFIKRLKYNTAYRIAIDNDKKTINLYTFRNFNKYTYKFNELKNIKIDKYIILIFDDIKIKYEQNNEDLKSIATKIYYENNQ